MRLLFSLFLLFNCISLSNSSIAIAANIEEGEKIFTANCAACHAGGNNVIMPAKTLKIEALEEYGMDSIQAIKNQVTNGKNAMPAFQGRLNGDDIDNVANYVLSQSKSGWGDED
uniref:Cytochrome c6 n=1 Tax=Centroceras clavulatum TaxID=159503 RepID=A0A4D6WNP8_9FLOR|nr:cytochrome c553 [Centroceras clavulatum]